MMRRFAIAMCLLLFIVISISDQSKAQRRRSASSTTNASASRESTLNNEARRLVAQYWSKYLIKCGGSYFLYSDTRLFEFRDKPQFVFNGQALSPKPLSRVEILNGVDPLPVEWDGSIGINFDVCRMNTAYFDKHNPGTFWHGWSKWGNYGCGYSTRLWRKKGQWEFFQVPKQASCDELSKWGFVFIPEGVRGAKAEARAEFDARTRAMLRDAPNVGIYMSQTPQFPMDYFRAMYSRAKNGNLYKTKLFSGGYYVFFDRNGQVFPGNTSDFKLPTRMAETFRRYNDGMREVAIGPNNSWVEILPYYGVTEKYVFEGENIPNTLSDALNSLWSNEYNPQIRREWRPRFIALGPNESWVLFYGQNNWKCHCSADIQKALQGAQENGYLLKQFIYTDDGEWLVLYDDRFFANSENFPKEIINKLTELYDNRINFDQVILAPNGAWLIGGKFSKGHDWEVLR